MDAEAHRIRVASYVATAIGSIVILLVVITLPVMIASLDEVENEMQLHMRDFKVGN